MRQVKKKLFLVTRKYDETDVFNDTHVICNAMSRENAKGYSQPLLGGNPDEYIVSPLTNEGEKVYINVYL